ncbi:K02A2.6-like [Cordylochernes scorpioides]|uniref:RNA-directed DNA polymerase n=1 Tax=Cordylochernes scorpioides TaxID=51811 RepID=A0ABY6KY39_9ARAC|nr:K02A2.6-like [Cordylochernes scorpioides]
MLSNADFLRDDNNIPNPDDEESETDDHIEERNWSTDTEQYTLSEEENNEDPSFNYYIGKDQKTKWKKALPPKNVRTRSENIITHLPGVKGEAKNAKSILDCWNLFIDDNILECIVTNTNIYIRNIQQNYSRERDANLTNLHEIKALLGIIYFLGVMKANKMNTDDAWARDSTGFELCRIAMSENRFRFLLRVIRFDDKATRNERLRQDKLAAVRLILDTFVKNCQKHYSPSEYITVDEKLDAFRGKCNFRQYIPSKHNKYGIKLFALVDSKMFYTCNLEIYSGKNPEGPYNVSNSPSDVVERLCEPIKGTGRNVTMDNWFTSYSLALKLLQQFRLTIVGTLKRNKKEIPSEFVISRDMMDEMTATYNCARNSRRWPMVIFYSLLNIGAINSQIIHFANGNASKVKSRRHFLKTLSLDLIEEMVKVRTTYLEHAKAKFSKHYQSLNPNKITTTVGLNTTPNMEYKCCSFCIPGLGALTGNFTSVNGTQCCVAVGRIDLDGIRLNFWDLGGQQELQLLWDKYYAECHGVIYIVDCSDQERMEETKNAFMKRNYTLKMSSSMFERFDENLENVENYIYRLKQFMLISKTKEDFKTPFLISSIGPKYFGILRNLVFPEEVDQVPFDKLCGILLKHFNPKINIIYERFVFQKMDQKSGETISKYIIRLKEQAQRCNFGDVLQESLRDRFVAGIIDTPTQKKLLQEEGLTFEGALDIALSAESADNDLHNLKRSEDAHLSPQHLHAINNPCKHCGKTNHLHYNCFFKSANCRVCGRVGHISTICYKKDSSARKLPRNPKNTFNKFKKHVNDNNPSGSQNNLSLNNINLHPPLIETVYVNDIKLLAEIDTGAAITTLTKYLYFKYFKNVKLNKCNTVLTGYRGSKIPILGKAKFDIKLRNVSRTIEILITNLNCSKFLLGRDFLNLFNISFNYLHKLDSFSIDSLLNDYESIFECKSDPIKGIKCHLDVKADFVPKFYKFRQVPFALKQLVENEIDKLVDLNILSPIDKSECASPLVCVAKPNGQIRLCADFKKSLNPYLEDVKYPIPNIDSVLSNFQGKKLFTKLDLSKAYHQIEMDDISKKYLVVSTHKGLYKYNRLAFGIKTASEIFQKTMESFFSGIRDVYIYFDDILIASEDLESHLDILKKTLNILKENNFTINKNKCLFVKNEIEYLGHKINEFGIYPLKDKLACIKNCPVPKNITELKSFLGFLSFYSKFLPNLSDLAYPLYNLLKKNVKWSWNAGTDRSFNSCKNALDETTCLSHYSLNLPLILSCDASQVGIGATLSHLKDGEERPVCFISRTLNVHERKYSQVEREGLAIVFAVNKLKNYLFGRKFTIYTDHKPLITIFGDKTNLPPLIANRLHRWALTLSNYSFEIKYKKGKDNIIPDFLSRFPEFQEDNLEYNDGSGEILLLNTSIIDHVLVAHEIQLDRTLFKLYKIIETGEVPSSPNDDLIPYLKRIDDFTILQECIFLENRMVIPKSLHERVLQILHESHAGTNKMKMMARSSIWWPGMDSSIEIITKNCRTCLSNESLPPQRTESWPKYAGPWRRVHMDYFNFKNKLFLLAVDSFSSWVEVSEVPSTSAYFCINFMRNCIARYGFPQVVVSDNGPPFFSSDFGDFLSKNGISHVTSPPYHPQSNGQAEVSVREVKKLLKKQLYENEQVELNLALSRALFFIRTDVNIRKGTSPAELFLGRKIRSRLSVLSKEEVKASKFNSQYVNSKFKVDETVKFRWITNGHPSWYTGKIIKILGRNVYLIKQGDSIKKVHQNYIRKMLPGKSHSTNMNNAESVPTPISEEKSITTPRYPQRERRCPQRYGE